MQRLTIMHLPGDPDGLLAAKREHIDPVMEQKAGQYGHIMHAAARGPDGMVIVNLWESEEASEQAFQDPDVQRGRDAMRASGAATGLPNVSHYELVDYRTPKSG